MKSDGPTMMQPGTMPLRRRHQVRVAAAVLLGPWLFTLLICWDRCGRHPAVLLGLLPGLAAALRLQGELRRHLDANHREAEAAHPFTTLGAANWITLLRAGATVGLAGFLPPAIQGGGTLAGALGWVPGIIYLAVSLADLVDGYVARRQGRETLLGQRLDMEADAAGLLVASLVAVALGRLPALYLLAGLAYYLFRFGIWLRTRRGLPVGTLKPKPFRRLIAGFQMGLVALALLPVFHPSLLCLGALIFLTPLLAGFWQDWRVVSCQVSGDTQPLAALPGQADRWIFSILPVALRLVMLAGGIATLDSHGLLPADPLWQAAHSLCCLLAGVGCLGRSASLALALMLASNLSPVAISAAAMVTFGASAALMLTGTGALTLWAPEDRILNRR